MQDPISDMLTRIRNGQMASHSEVSVPASKAKMAILAVLEEEGYISGYKVEGEIKKQIKIGLRSYQGKPVIAKITRVSKPSIRKYSGVKELPNVNGGLGVAIISTSKGVMSYAKAKALGLGGEIICEVM